MPDRWKQIYTEVLYIIATQHLYIDDIDENIAVETEKYNKVQ